MKKIASIICTCLLAACGGDSDTSITTGQFSIGLTDAPVDEASAVVVSFSSISVKPQDGEAVVITLDESLTVDLLAYQGEDRIMLLDNYELDTGEYNWMRLEIVETDSYIEVAGERHPLEIPSGAESGLHLNRGFTVAAGTVTDFTLDFDLRKSVRQEGTGDYRLRPTIRIVNSLEVGSITGTVANELIIRESCNNGDNDDVGNAVYIYEGLDQIAQDVQGVDGDPLASAAVSFNSGTERYEYVAGFIATGDYTVAFTCDGSLDIPDEDNSDVVVFSDPINVTVENGESVSADFVLP